MCDFGEKPDDGKCGISAIRKAFAHAVANKATTVRFDVGVYDLNIGDATKDILEIDGAENLSIVGTKVGFWKNKSEEVLLTIKSVRKSDKKVGHNSQPAYEVEFVEPIPDFVCETTLCNLYALNPDSYVLINSTFKNIAGCASLICNDNVNIAGCRFDHIMYPAVCVGGAIAEVEGVISKTAYIWKRVQPLRLVGSPRLGGGSCRTHSAIPKDSD